MVKRPASNDDPATSSEASGDNFKVPALPGQSSEGEPPAKASCDGHLKFWKKKYAEGVEFVKHFRCHLHAFSHICVNFNGTLLATVCSEDNTVKIFDVENFDMINMIKVDFSPKTAAWIHQGSDVVNTLAISDRDSGKIVVVDGKGISDPLHTLTTLHTKPVRCIEVTSYFLPLNLFEGLVEYNWKLDLVISTDDAGMIEMWRGEKGNYLFPSDILKWEVCTIPSLGFKVLLQSKLDTDLYDLVKTKTLAVCVRISPKGDSFAVMSEDRRIRFFDQLSGKLTKTLDLSLARYIEMGKTNKNFGLQSMEWNRRVAVEKELDKEKEKTFRFWTMTYDVSGFFLLFPSILGIEVYNIVTDQVVRRIGQEETLRLSLVSLCRAVPDIRSKLQGAAATVETETADNPNLNRTLDPDPVMVCAAYRKNRFYLFTNTEPFSTEIDEVGGTGRDIFNEKPKKEDTITAVESEKSYRLLSNAATIHTTMGDIHLELFPNECPKTVENFCTHARRGYYNGLTFHRVIRSFMIQTGDPTGKGTGGESIWGHDFEDEFHPTLRHDKPYKVSMANAGPNSNGSQFFITTVPAEWLDGKNTLFGEVTEGFNVVQKINTVPTHPKSGRPKDEIKVISITLK